MRTTPHKNPADPACGVSQGTPAHTPQTPHAPKHAGCGLRGATPHKTFMRGPLFFEPCRSEFFALTPSESKPERTAP